MGENVRTRKSTNSFYFAVTYFVVAFHGVVPVRLGLSGPVVDPPSVILVCTVHGTADTFGLEPRKLVCDLSCSSEAVLRRRYYINTICYTYTTAFSTTTFRNVGLKKNNFFPKKNRGRRRSPHDWLRRTSMKNALTSVWPFESVRRVNREWK